MNQFQFLLPGQLLDGIFPSHSFFFCFISFIIDQLYRSFGFCIFSTGFLFIMCFYSLLNIGCPSCIQCSVSTFHYICVIHDLLHPSSPVLCKGQPHKGSHPYLYKKQPVLSWYSCITQIKQVGELPTADCHSHLLYYTFYLFFCE